MVLFILFFVLPLPLLIWFFIRTKNRETQWFLGIAIVLFVSFLSFVAFGLWVMDVEDLYGDKQEIFWEGKSGDTIKLIDDNTKQVLATGILKKTWHRIKIKTHEKEIDIYEWIENEAGNASVNTRNEFKNKKIEIFILHQRQND